MVHSLQMTGKGKQLPPSPLKSFFYLYPLPLTPPPENQSQSIKWLCHSQQSLTFLSLLHLSLFHLLPSNLTPLSLSHHPILNYLLFELFLSSMPSKTAAELPQIPIPSPESLCTNPSPTKFLLQTPPILLLMPWKMERPVSRSISRECFFFFVFFFFLCISA